MGDETETITADPDPEESSPTNFASIALACVSGVAGLLLVRWLFNRAHVDLPLILEKIRTLDTWAVARYTLWMGINIYLSSVKWRLTADAMEPSVRERISAGAAFSCTAFGVALGQVLPAPISMTVARTVTASFYGHAFRRGTIGTLFEQGFDFAAVLILSAASLATLFFHLGISLWFAIASLLACVMFLSLGAILSRANRFASTEGLSRWRRSLFAIHSSGLMKAPLASRLLAISLVRVGIMALTANETSAAIHAPVGLSAVTIAVPLVVFSTVTGITPGGIGVMEATYVGVFHLLGIPLAIATQWSVATRLLSLGSSLLIALSAAFAVAIFKARNHVARAADGPK